MQIHKGYCTKVPSKRLLHIIYSFFFWSFPTAGSVKNGIILLPDNRSMIYALGSTIVKRDIVNSHDQQFLQVRCPAPTTRHSSSRAHKHFFLSTLFCTTYHGANISA
jgi:hypothetical protein